MKNTLLLASTSESRKRLLHDAGIPFTCIPMDADEKQCDWTLPLTQLVESIASYKMAHVVLPLGQEGQEIVVLTADTLSQDATGKVMGKPVDLDDAKTMLRAARGGMRTCTAFCLEKKLFQSGSWHTQHRILQHVDTRYEFEIPESWIDWYAATSRGIHCSGAIATEEHGALFLRSVHGSYTTIVGLPLFELRKALESMNFFNEGFTHVPKF